MDALVFHAADRHAVRRAARVPCQVVREQDFSLLAHTTLDVSEDGILVVARTLDVWLYEEVIVSLQVPRTTRWIDAIGYVSRIVQDRRPEDPARSFAIRFCEIDAVDQTLLTASLRGLPPPVPRRPLRIDYATTASVITLAA